MRHCPVCRHQECTDTGSLRCLRLHLSPPEIHTPLNYALGVLATVVWFFTLFPW